jgi:Zn-dependent peptidase ImmA (M78 family)
MAETRYLFTHSTENSECHNENLSPRSSHYWFIISFTAILALIVSVKYKVICVQRQVPMYKNLTQYRLLEECAEQVLEQYSKRSNIDIRPPVSVEAIAKVLGFKWIIGDLDKLFEGTEGALVEDDGVIIVNYNNKNERRRFSIAHEIGHIILPGFDNPSDCLHYGYNAVVHPEKRPHLREVACNKFAGALLMPRNILCKEIQKYPLLNDKRVFQLARTFRVSPLAMLTRIEYLTKNLVQISNLDWNSLDSLKTYLLNTKWSAQLSFDKLVTVHKDSRIIYNNEQSHIIQIISNKLMQLGLTRLAFRNGSKVETIRTPLEVLGRPLVIEFAGTPNSGKDTQIQILKDYFRDYRGFTVSVIDETYNSCNIESGYDKRIFWMYGTVIRNLMEITDEKKVDVVMINRGLFDTLAFLDLYCKQGHISKRELIAYSSSLTTKRLSSIEDIVIVLTTTPEVSLQREKIYPRNTVAGLAEKLDQWNPNPKSTITNEDGLVTINACYANVLEKYRKAFGDVYYLEDDGNNTIDNIAINIGSHIHPLLFGDTNTFRKELLLQHRKLIQSASQLSFSDLLSNSKPIDH